MTGILEYDSNNSGGDWWLKDQDWYNLENAGWTVHWHLRDKEYDDREPLERRTNNGHLWLGGLASEAAKKFDSREQGIEEWERITEQYHAAEGCNCCGNPHNFDWTDEGGETRHSHVEVTRTERVWR
jgi:hypothetical protein